MIVPTFSARRRGLVSAGRSPVASSLLVLLLLILAVTACASKLSPQKAIVGKWVNAGGYSIEFYANGTGFVPGVKGQIPPYNFNYSFRDETHVELNVAGLTGMVVEIRIDGDQMTWLSQADSARFVYTRAK